MGAGVFQKLLMGQGCFLVETPLAQQEPAMGYDVYAGKMDTPSQGTPCMGPVLDFGAGSDSSFGFQTFHDIASAIGLDMGHDPRLPFEQAAAIVEAAQPAAFAAHPDAARLGRSLAILKDIIAVGRKHGATDFVVV